MKISHRWLGEWVQSGLSAEEIAERFTLSGLEVDAIEAVAPSLDGVVVAEITAVEPHRTHSAGHYSRIGQGHL